jgi:CIC family chloride channel protein
VISTRSGDGSGIGWGDGTPLEGETKTGMLRRDHRLLLDAVLLGVVGALGAQAFTFLLHLAEHLFLRGLAAYIPPGLPDEGGVLRQVIGPHGLWWIPLATTLGGLISGVLVYSLAPEAEGHGTDTAVKAFHRSGGFIRPRVTPLKMVASAVTIGSGGAAGREGPTALISAGIGSIYATLTRRSDEDRRLLVLVGMAAGLSAIFRSPIGTALFAVEVLYGEMEFEGAALLYTMLASIVAYVLNGVFVGWLPLFQVPAGLGDPGFADYVWYAVLGLASGVVAAWLPLLFYRVRDGFHAIPIPPHFKPALGGLGVGLLALWLPQVLGGGYGWIQEAIDGRLAARLLLLLVLVKGLAFALTVSSGGSGGVFAPTLFVGAMLGGWLAQTTSHSPAAFVVVGMAAVFSGAARVPMATLLMVTEMTGSYRLLVPAALAVFLSYFVQRLLSERLRYRSLYEAQVSTRADSPTHQAEQLHNALRLVKEGRAAVHGPLGRLELTALLESGVAIDLGDGRELVLASPRPGSAWIGGTLPPLLADADGARTVAVLRGVRVLSPDGVRSLERDDRLLLVLAPEAWRQVGEHLVRAGGAHLDVSLRGAPSPQRPASGPDPPADGE